MGDMFRSLYYRLTSGAYVVPAVVIEVVLIALCVNWCASILQGTRGTRPLRGVLVILVATTLVVRVLTAQFEWERLELLYNYVLYALAFIALVVFQPELRRAVIRMGDVRLRRAGGMPTSQVIAALVKSAGYLSRNKYGALIAIEREVDLSGWAENGTLVHASVSANLLNTIFFPNSPLHDLGVIVRGDQVVAANCQFPSVESDEVDLALGSRHLAAVGMSYETDALVLVVSEETGVISLADQGKLTRYLSLDDLSDELVQRLGSPLRQASTSRGLSGTPAVGRGLWNRARRAALVVPLALVVWYVADQATSITDTFQVQLDLSHEDPASEVELAGAPVIFDATFSGPARAIDRTRAIYGARPLQVTFTLSRSRFDARPAPYAIDDRDQIRQIVEDSRVVREGGLAVVRVERSDLRFAVHERVSVTLPVKVRAAAGNVAITTEQVDPPQVEVRLRKKDLPKLEAQGYVQAMLIEQLEGLLPGEARPFDSVPLQDPTNLGLSGPVQITPRTVRVVIRVVAQRQPVKNLIVRLYVAPEVLETFDVRRSDLNEWRIDIEVQGEAAVAEQPQELVEAIVLVGADVLPPPGEPAVEHSRTLDITFLPRKGISVAERRSVTVLLKPRAQARP